MLHTVLHIPLWALPVVCVLLTAVGLIYNRYFHGITSIPGPLLASCTDLWRLYNVWGQRPEVTHIKLHEKYGSLVRLGPKVVSISDPEAIRIVYGLPATFVKSDFYTVQQQAVTKDGHLLQGMFNTTDEVYHAKLRRAVNSAYAMSTLVQFEPFVDSTTTAFLSQLEQRYADKPTMICDFGEWLQFYAFDVIGELTFSKRLGFVDHGVDVDNIIRDLEWSLGYFAVVGQVPSLDRLLMKNPIRLWLSRIGLINVTSPVAIFAKARMDTRLDKKDLMIDDNISEKTQSRRDFLSRFMEAVEKDPVFMTPQRVLSLTSANIFAGSDTTAISLRSIFYHLLRSPATLEVLRHELEEAERSGIFARTDSVVSWMEANQLPYLSAVIKEGLRVHPAAGLLLERIVPPGGTTINGHFLPAGTIVGCSAWTIHRDKTIFGEDAHLFRPERWTETPERTAAMNQYLFSFGAGARTCVGKNVSYLEMYKLVPAVLRTFDLQLAYPEEEWHLENKWFVKQSRFYVKLTTREKSRGV